MLVKPEDAESKEPPIIEYECLTCHRRYRLRGPKFYEVLADGIERAYMREGRYGRWLSCRSNPQRQTLPWHQLSTLIHRQPYGVFTP
jgi:hypothetical protein